MKTTSYHDTMAAQVAIAIENATLYERIARQEKRWSKTWRWPRVQFRLLPQKLRCSRMPKSRRGLRRRVRSAATSTTS